MLGSPPPIRMEDLLVLVPSDKHGLRLQVHPGPICCATYGGFCRKRAFADEEKGASPPAPFLDTYRTDPRVFPKHLKVDHDLATRTVEESEGTSRASLPATWRSFTASEVGTDGPVRFRPKPYLGYNRPGACCGRLGGGQAKRGGFPPKPRGAARVCGDGTCPPRGEAGKVATQHHRAATRSVQQWLHMAT